MSSIHPSKLSLLWRTFAYQLVTQNGCGNKEETFLRLKECTRDTAHGWDATSLDHILDSLVSTGYHDGALLNHLVAQFSPSVIQSMTASQVSRATWCFCKLGLEMVETMQWLWKRATHLDIICMLSPRDIGNIIWAMGHSRVVTFPWFLSLLLRRMGTFPYWMGMTAGTVAQICWGLARLGLFMWDSMRFLVSRLFWNDEIARCTAEDASALLWACGQIGADGEDEQLHARLVQCISQKVGTCSILQCVDILESLAALRYKEPDIVIAVMDHLFVHHGASLTTGLVLRIGACVSMGPHSISTAMVQKWVIQYSATWTGAKEQMTALVSALVSLGPGATQGLYIVMKAAITSNKGKSIRFNDARILLMGMAHLPRCQHHAGWRHRVVQALLQQWSDHRLDRLQLVDLFWALGILAPGNKWLTMQACNHATHVFSGTVRMTPGEMTCMAWCLARNNCNHQGLLDRILASARGVITGSPLDVIATFVSSLACLNVRDDGLLSSVAAALGGTSAKNPSDPLMLTRLLWVWAYFNRTEDQVFLLHITRCLLQEVCILCVYHHLSLPVPQKRPPVAIIGVLVWSLATLRVYVPEFLPLLASWVVECIHQMSPVVICNVAIFFDVVGHMHIKGLLEVMVPILLQPHALEDIPTRGLQHLINVMGRVQGCPGAPLVVAQANCALDSRCIDLTEDSPKAFRPPVGPPLPLPCAPPDCATIPLGAWMAA